MSERNLSCKRDARDSEFEEASSISVKKKKLDDSSADSHVAVSSSSSSVASSADSASGGCSVTSVGEDDDQGSSICSGCFSSETNEIARNNPAFVVDLEVKFLKSEALFKKKKKLEEKQSSIFLSFSPVSLTRNIDFVSVSVFRLIKSPKPKHQHSSPAISG